MKKFFFLVFVNVSLLAVLLEIGSLGAYAMRRGELFYSRDILKYDDRGSALFSGNFFKQLDMVIHPYFGYVERFVENKTNNHGFRNPSKEATCCDFPFVPKENQAVVGIFGGSVAGALGIIARNDDYLRSKFEKIPAFADKEIVFLSFATGGYRQPQQVMILTYYLLLGQKFDAIVNVDGFNELVTAFHNNRDEIDISMPATDIFYNTGRHIERVNMRGGDGKGVVLAYHTWKYIDTGRKAEHCVLASCFILYKIQQIYHQIRRDSVEGVQRKSWRDYTHFYLPKKHKQEENRLSSENLDDLMEKEATLWEASTRAMALLAKDAGALYVHIVQPTLLYVVGKHIKPKNPQNPYGYLMKPLEIGYPKLIKRIPALRADGIGIIDSTAMFDHVDEAVYADDCCHYNMKGMYMLEDVVAEQLEAISN